MRTNWIAPSLDARGGRAEPRPPAGGVKPASGGIGGSAAARRSGVSAAAERTVVPATPSSRGKLSGRRPGSTAERHAADVRDCRAVLRRNSRTFHLASLLLPRAVRDPACVLYGFCRLADDLVDLEGGRLDAVAHLADRIGRAYAGEPWPVPADRALAAVVRRHGIPQAVFDALLEGLRWDAEGRRYETPEALLDYAARVAGTVGVMMALVMGAASRGALARAADLGVAMQLSNIARDVGEDARMGRVYLPLSWLRDAGIDAEAWLAAPVFTPALGGVVQRLLDTADALYRRAGGGIACLPTGCRPGINAARFLYAAIGREVERRGLDSVTSRAVVPGVAKLRLLVGASVCLAPACGAPMPPLAATRFFVDASARRDAPGRPRSEPAAWWQLPQRLIDTFALFDRLGRRDGGWP